MHVLCLDTATPAVTAGLARIVDDRLVEVMARPAPRDARGHGELLAPAIAAALADAGVAAAQLDAVVVGLGPGPYTGLRVGVVTAAAVADAAGCPAYGVCTLDAISRSAPLPAGTTLVATDARRREVYWGLYDAAGARLDGPAVDRPDRVVAALAGRRVATVLGGGAVKYSDLFGPLTDSVSSIRDADPTPAGMIAVALADGVFGGPTHPLQPLYLRRPDAVEAAARR